MKSRWIKIGVGVFAAFVLLSILKNSIADWAIAAGLSKAAHVPVSIGKTRVGLLSGSMRLEDIRLQNPPGFEEKWMLDAPEVSIDFEPTGLFQGIFHFKEVELNLNELTVIRNRDGKLNVDTLKPPAKEETEKPEKKKTVLKIDKLYLTAGKVVYKDYSAGPTPAVQEFNIGIDKKLYTNIEDPSALVRLIVFETLTRTALTKVLDMSLFKDGAMGVLSQGLGAVGEGTDALEDTAKGILNLFK